jgi:hypothetical protein
VNGGFCSVLKLRRVGRDGAAEEDLTKSGAVPLRDEARSPIIVTTAIVPQSSGVCHDFPFGVQRNERALKVSCDYSWTLPSFKLGLLKCKRVAFSRVLAISVLETLNISLLLKPASSP